jgi:nucleoside-diphosphate-sugar epimerase
MKVLLTGAAGRLGSCVCRALVELGHEVRATDYRLLTYMPAEFVLADLRDGVVVRSLVRGCEAIVHLGNYPNLAAAPPERLRVENAAMNANVFDAGVEHGVTRFVFSSTIQVMIPMPEGKPPRAPYPLPFLPLDGSAEANPGPNAYARSKELAERSLRLLAAERTGVRCTVLRFPYIADAAWLRRFDPGNPVAEERLNFGEALSFVRSEDAASVIGCALERQEPGYHQYFPAQSVAIEGVSAAAIVRRYYPHVPLRRPLEAIDALIDDRALRAELGWRPSAMYAVALERPWDHGKSVEGRERGRRAT